MASIDIEVKMPRRSAVARINTYLSAIVDIPEGEQPCYVLGTFQEKNEDGFCPVFVCEFPDGKVVNIYTELVRFTDTEGGILK